GPSLALADLEGPEAGEGHLAATGDLGGHRRQQRVDGLLHRFLRELRHVRHAVHQVGLAHGLGIRHARAPLELCTRAEYRACHACQVAFCPPTRRRAWLPSTEMSAELLLVVAILVGAVVLFVTDKVRLDAVAVLVVLALAFAGVVTPAQALAGFADPLVAVIAGLFVVSAALTQTGLAGAVGAWLARVAGGHPLRMTVAVMVATATLSAFMSSTGTVAIMLPIVVRLAYRFEVSPSKLLIPVAYAAMIGGTLTLIATPPNLVASQTLADAGFGALGFFTLAPIGLALLAVSVSYMAT